MQRKGQITMESLLLYGLAILVVLLAVGALTYFGVLDLGKFLPDRCNLAGSGTVSCAEFTFSTGNSALKLGIKNDGAKQITITDAKFISDQGFTCDSGTSTTANPGQDVPVTIVCPSSATMPDAGKKIKGNLDITYTVGSIDVTTGGSIVVTATQ